MQASFLKVLPITLKFEGGWSDNRNDPGGATMHGVTQRTYDAYRKACKLPHRTVAAIDAAELSQIYHQIWSACRGDTLPAGVDALTFDIAVNSGTGEATKLCERARLKSYVPFDGYVTSTWIVQLDAQRRGFWRHLRIFRYFGLGWFKREDAMLALAKQLAAPKP